MLDFRFGNSITGEDYGPTVCVGWSDMDFVMLISRECRRVVSLFR